MYKSTTIKSHLMLNRFHDESKIQLISESPNQNFFVSLFIRTTKLLTLLYLNQQRMKKKLKYVWATELKNKKKWNIYSILFRFVDLIHHPFELIEKKYCCVRVFVFATVVRSVSMLIWGTDDIDDTIYFFFVLLLLLCVARERTTYGLFIFFTCLFAHQY